MEDPQNKFSDDAYGDDERESFFLKNDDGSTTIMRKFGGEWHEYRTGRSATADDEDDE